MVERRDADNHVTTFQRDSRGRLNKMAADDRWIEFVYDTGGRVASARGSNGATVQYGYDPAGRLGTVTESTGHIRQYTYTEADLMATIDEPGHRIQNFYDDQGRCVRQDNYSPGQTLPYVFQFTYLVTGDRTVGTEEQESDGSWTQVTFDKDRLETSETFGMTGVTPIAFTYVRDPVSHGIVNVSVTCADRTGHVASHESNVGDRGEDGTKRDLVQMFCARPGSPFRPR
jgi:YD repeat-containing protein